MHRFFGITLIVLAIAIAVVPTFTDCQSQGQSVTTASGKQIPMKCHWTGIAEIGMAVPLAVVGGMMTLNQRRKDNLRNLAVIGVVLGALAISFPAGLIGVCPTPTMICHTTMSPVLITLGSLTIVGSLGALVSTRKMKV